MVRPRMRRADPLAVGQEKLDDVVAVGLEHHAGAAVLANLLLGPLDHAVALAGVGRLHLALGRDLEALFSARLGLQLGHFALLQVRLWTQQRAGPAGCAQYERAEWISLAATAALV